MIVQLNERMLHAIGFDAQSIAALRHFARQVGVVTNATSLPEVAALADNLTPIVNGLVITVKATSAAVADLETDTTEHRPSDAAVMRRLDELQAALEQSRIECAGLRRAIEEAAINGEAIDAQFTGLARRITQLEDA